jgi:hypothetical protein
MKYGVCRTLLPSSVDSWFPSSVQGRHGHGCRYPSGFRGRMNSPQHCQRMRLSSSAPTGPPVPLQHKGSGRQRWGRVAARGTAPSGGCGRRGKGTQGTASGGRTEGEGTELCGPAVAYPYSIPPSGDMIHRKSTQIKLFWYNQRLPAFISNSQENHDFSNRVIGGIIVLFA